MHFIDNEFDRKTSDVDNRDESSDVVTSFDDSRGSKPAMIKTFEGAGVRLAQRAEVRLQPSHCTLSMTTLMEKRVLKFKNEALTKNKAWAHPRTKWARPKSSRTRYQPQ